jgi:uncharacterized SAM-binding protein YcdF (DUF218 family)
LPTILWHPGAFTPDGELDGVTIARGKKAICLFVRFLKDFPVKDIYFISSVGDKGREGRSQSELMREWLIKQGVQPERIIISSESHNTWGDVRQSLGLVWIRNLPQPVYHVSNWNHIWPRIWLIAAFWGKKYRVKNKFASIGWMDFKNSIREGGALVKAIGLMLKESIS